ncbi:MAG: serine hydrolase, partial [Bacteroidales bacterium]|nr:serine hydrolase [Bacteroidales bacterium]
MKRKTGRCVLILLVTAISSSFYHFTPDTGKDYSEFRLRKVAESPGFLKAPDYWADSVLMSLSMEERIAQMIMVAAYSDHNKENEQEVKELIQTYNIGGLIFFHGSPYHQAGLTNIYQSIAKTPLCIAMDAEWGIGMRLDSTISYPRQMMLGASRNEKFIYEMGSQIAEQLSRIGVHINFAPVADVNNNPENPVINSRSFGEDRANVTSKSLLYMRGMQDNGIMAVAKHFPGHGDTDIDSHADLPVISHSFSRLDSLELFPFKELINSGISGIMTAHLQIPAIDSLDGIPSSLSRIVIDSLLKGELGFNGLVFTDAMSMKGITNYFLPEEAVEKAVLAGNDILVMPGDVRLAIKTISGMIRDGIISEGEINSRCQKILLAKFWMGLSEYKPVDLQNINNDLNKDEYRLLERKLIESSLTVLSNKNGLLPFRRLDTLSIASVSFGDPGDSTFQKSLNLYTTVRQYHIQEGAKYVWDSILNEISNCNIVIANLHSNDRRAGTQYGIANDMIELIDLLSKFRNVVLNVFANPYILDRFEDPDRFSAIVVSYENSDIVQDLSAQMMFGAFGASGMLPVSVGRWNALLSGQEVQGINRLKYSIPLEAGMNRKILEQIDDTISVSIACQAMPGCQVMVVRNGIVIMNKAYGHHEYNGVRKVKTTDLYDLASVTKAGATVPAIMKLYDEGILDIREKISAYLPDLKSTNKRN